MDFETLEKDVEQLFKIERQFTAMQAKAQKLAERLDRKRYKLSQLKPQLYALEQDKQTLSHSKEELEDKLYEAEVELQSLKQLFRDAENPELTKKYHTLRSTMRQSMARGGGRATNARMSMI